jgi:hypothetical protein
MERKNSERILFGGKHQRLKKLFPTQAAHEQVDTMNEGRND